MTLFIKTAQTKCVIGAAGGDNLYRASRRFPSEQRLLSFSSCMDTYSLRNANDCQVGKWCNYTHQCVPAFGGDGTNLAGQVAVQGLLLSANRGVSVLGSVYLCCPRQSEGCPRQNLTDAHDRIWRMPTIESDGCPRQNLTDAHDRIWRMPTIESDGYPRRFRRMPTIESDACPR